MASWYIFGLLLCLSLVNVLVKGEDLNVGDPFNTTLVYIETVKLSSIPLTQREKNVFYNNGTHPKIIKAISAIDFDRSKASVKITSGGVGSSFVNVRLKSKRGNGLNYQVSIFA